MRPRYPPLDYHDLAFSEHACRFRLACSLFSMGPLSGTEPCLELIRECILLRGQRQDPHGPANQLAAVRVYRGMDTTLIRTKFEKLGARAKIRPLAMNRRESASGRLVIDVRHDRHGEFFDIQADDDADAEVLDVGHPCGTATRVFLLVDRASGRTSTITNDRWSGIMNDRSSSVCRLRGNRRNICAGPQQRCTLRLSTETPS